MLDLLRKNSKHWSVTFIMVIATLSMVFFFGSYNGQRKINRTSIASVGDERISYNEFYQKYNRILNYYKKQLGDNFSEKMLEMYGVKQQLINSMISDILIYKDAEYSHIPVIDEEIRDIIVSYPYFQKNGKFDIALYKQLLPRLRTTVKDFEKEQKIQLVKRRVEDLIVNSVKLSDKEIENLYKAKNAKLELELLSFDPSTIKVVVRKAELEQYLSKNFTKVKDYYIKNNSEFIVPDKRELYWLKVSFDSKDLKSKEEAKRKIESLQLGLAKNNFKEITKKYSDAPKKGIMGLVARNELPNKVANTTFELGVGDMSDIFETDTAFNIVYVKAEKKTYVQDLAVVKSSIAKKLLMKEKKENLVKRKIATLKKIKSLRSLKRVLKQKPKELKVSLLDNKLEGVPGNNASLVAWLFSLETKRLYSKNLMGVEYFFYLKTKDGLKTKKLNYAKLRKEYSRELGGEEFVLYTKNLRIKHKDDIKISSLFTRNRRRR